jgi:hypothetical protein
VFDAFAFLARVECARGKFARNPNVKGQAALQLDLPIEQMNRLGNGQPQVRKNVFNFMFEARFNPGANVGGFAYAVNVALLGIHDKVSFIHLLKSFQSTEREYEFDSMRAHGLRLPDVKVSMKQVKMNHYVAKQLEESQTTRYFSVRPVILN